MCGKRIHKGKTFESELSKELIRKSGTSNYVIFLASPLILRERECGQVDLAYFNRKNDWELTLIEAKNGSMVAGRQKKRLENSAIFLGHLFDVNVKLKCVAKM